jgi:hypothetical protein
MQRNARIRFVAARQEINFAVHSARQQKVPPLLHANAVTLVAKAKCSTLSLTPWFGEENE